VLEGFDNAVEDESFLEHDTVLIVDSERLVASIFRVIGLPWTLMQDGPLKCLWIVTDGHGVISKKTLFFFFFFSRKFCCSIPEAKFFSFSLVP
jgi:hypothetical protein